jgi:hypothetical protein
MAIDYMRPLPGGAPMTEFPAAIKAKVRSTSENATVSSVITVSQDTVQLEVAAVGQAAAIRWVPTTDTEASIITIAGATSNYDHIIPSGQVRRFVIPIESQGLGQGSMVGVNRLNGLYRRVALKSSGIGSVLVAEY